MALYTPGPMAGQISGRIGASVFSHNRGGTYVRNGTIPIKVISGPAVAAKNRMKAIVRSWAAVGVASRLAWQTYCQENPITNRLGNKSTLSAHMAFSGINCRLNLIGAAAITLPPITEPPAALTALSAVCDRSLNSCLLTFAATPIPVSTAMWLEVAVVTSPAINYIENSWKVVGHLAAAVATGEDILSKIEARFGLLQVGQTVHIRASMIGTTNGLLSGPIQCSTVVVV